MRAVVAWILWIVGVVLVVVGVALAFGLAGGFVAAGVVAILWAALDVRGATLGDG